MDQVRADLGDDLSGMGGPTLSVYGSAHLRSAILAARAARTLGPGYAQQAFCGAVRRAGARFSVTVNMDPKIAAAIAAIPETAWTAIRYPRAIWDDQLRAWVSDAEVAETEAAARPIGRWIEAEVRPAWHARSSQPVYFTFWSPTEVRNAVMAVSAFSR
jgi:hypothetical protein